MWPLFLALLVTVVSDRVTVDWEKGELRAAGVAAADIRLPGPDIARVAAERAARRDAEKRLIAASAKIGWATGGTLADRFPADKLTGLAKVAETTYGSDGSARVVVSVTLDQLRGVASTRDVFPVDARSLAVSPTLGVEITVNGKRWDGPLLWTTAPPPAGAAQATSFEKGVLTVDRDPGATVLLISVKEAK